jgi:hypothetical protein
MIDRVIDKGIIETHDVDWTVPKKVIDDVLENGIVSTHDDVYHHKGRIDGVIKNGIKEVISYDEYKRGFVNQFGYLDDIIETGVKETKTPGDCDLVSTIEWMNENNTSNVPRMIDDVIENGVKEIKTPNKDGDIKSTLEWMYKNNYQDDYNGSKMINNVIENGVKETQPLPDQSGELIGYGNYYHGKEDRTKAFIDYLEETIKFGIKN